MARYLILDSEAISVLARPSERGASFKRARVILTSAHMHAAMIRVPAAVLAEVCRSQREDAALNRVIRRIARVIPTGQSIARLAGWLRAEHRLDTSSAIDAIVVATAVRLGGGLIATGDPSDLGRLAQRFSNVKILAL